MRHPLSSFVAFASTVAGASVAAVIVSSSAFADDMTTADTFSYADILTSAGPNQLQFRDAPADALKREYLMCERAATQTLLDPAEARACSVLYEQVRNRLFGGSFDALLDWWRGARDERMETQEQGSRGSRSLSLGR
jgi:hypothetical protein